MPDPITFGFLFKAATTIKTCVGWAQQAYRHVRKETPESNAIAATAEEFPSSWNVKRALLRVRKTEEFESGLKRVRDGGEFGIEENVVNLLIDEGQFSSGITSTGKDALKVLRSFAHHYREALLHSSDANAVSTRRADEHHRELVDEIRKAGTASVSTDEILANARDAAQKLTTNWLAVVKLGDSEPIVLRGIKLDDQGHEVGLVRLADLSSLLKGGGRVILEGPAGRGKTTTLLQLAQSDDPQELHLYVDLPAWIDSGKSILTFLAETPEFQSLGVTGEHLA